MLLAVLNLCYISKLRTKSLFAGGEAGQVNADIDSQVFLMCPNVVLLNICCVCESAGDLKVQILIQ